MEGSGRAAAGRGGRGSSMALFGEDWKLEGEDDLASGWSRPNPEAAGVAASVFGSPAKGANPAGPDGAGAGAGAGEGSVGSPGGGAPIVQSQDEVQVVGEASLAPAAAAAAAAALTQDKGTKRPAAEPKAPSARDRAGKKQCRGCGAWVPLSEYPCNSAFCLRDKRALDAITKQCKDSEEDRTWLSNVRGDSRRALRLES